MIDRTRGTRRKQPIVFAAAGCIDLAASFGHKYRIGRDPAYAAEYGQRAVHDPWLLTIPCRRGEIYPHGGAVLAVGTRARGRICLALSAIPGVVVSQDGDDGINATFHVSLLPKVAAVIRPKSKRTLSPEHKATLVAAGRHHRLAPESNVAGDAKSRRFEGPMGNSATPA